MEYIITFKNTNHAIQAEQFLIERKIPLGVLPLPSQISAGCGICLRIPPQEIKAALLALTNLDIKILGVYTKANPRGTGSAIFTEITNWSRLMD